MKILNPAKIILAVSAVIFFTACKSEPERKSAVAEAANTGGGEDLVEISATQMAAGKILLGSMDRAEIPETLQLNGLVDVPPQNVVSISFPPGGYLKNTRLLPGMKVKRGEAIATLEDRGLIDLQQDYLMAKTRLKLSSLEFDRQKQLNETKSSADKIFQQADAEFENQRILVKALAEKLSLAGIAIENLNENTISRQVQLHSPINGYVSKINVNIGKYVQPSDVLFELINPDDLHAALTVFEKDINKIVPGQTVSVSFVDNPQQKFMAKVFLVTRNIDENRAGLIHCHFNKIPVNLRPGMYLNAELSLSSALRYFLPEDAVVRFENREFVFVKAAENKFRLTPVTTGLHYQGKVEIVNGGDAFFSKPIVVVNAFTLLSKMKNVAEE